MRQSFLCVGIDNGVTGTIGVISDFGIKDFVRVPTVVTKNYTKAPHNITRIDYECLRSFFFKLSNDIYAKSRKCNLDVTKFAFVERPMVNPRRFRTTQSALRALEAVLIALEQYFYEYSFIDSKEWQRSILDVDDVDFLLGSENLKGMSLSKGKDLYPELINNCDFVDADGLLIAHYGLEKMKKEMS